MSLQTTTSQTVGPFFRIGLDWLVRDNLIGKGVSGERVTVQGRLFDGDGLPVPDGILEIWQANAHGKYDHPEDKQQKPLEKGFTGYGRVPLSVDGVFRFVTIKPGPVPGPEGNNQEQLQAPHLAISVFMRGLLKRLVTRMYFPGDARNNNDPILNLVEPSRRPTLIAKKTAASPGTLEWNIVLQGPDETVFFDVGL
jgi:protocatechuate 3,4-dioxygenase, alpha subunit